MGAELDSHNFLSVAFSFLIFDIAFLSWFLQPYDSASLKIGFQLSTQV